MKQKDFECLYKTRRQLVEFLECAHDKDFTGVEACRFVLAYPLYYGISDKEIVDKIIDLVQNELDKLNKIIEGL